MEDLPLGRIAALVPEFAVKDLPLGRKLIVWACVCVCVCVCIHIVKVFYKACLLFSYPFNYSPGSLKFVTYFLSLFFKLPQSRPHMTFYDCSLDISSLIFWTL